MNYTIIAVGHPDGILISQLKANGKKEFVISIQEYEQRYEAIRYIGGGQVKVEIK